MHRLRDSIARIGGLHSVRVSFDLQNSEVRKDCREVGESGVEEIYYIEQGNGRKLRLSYFDGVSEWGRWRAVRYYIGIEIELELKFRELGRGYTGIGDGMERGG